MLEFIETMDMSLNRFYKFKRFLVDINLQKIPLGEFIFNLQYTKEKQEVIENKGKLFDQTILSNILSFCNLQDAHPTIRVNRLWRKSFISSLDYHINHILRELLYLKNNAVDSIYVKLPILFENNVYSSYFLMLDDMLDPKHDILSYEHINDIKNIKLQNEKIISICKAACVVLNEKVDKKMNIEGEITSLFIERVRTLAVSGQLIREIKGFNILNVSKKKLLKIKEELTPLLFDLDEIKGMNKGIYQLLIWILLVYEYNKTFNPFNLISSKYLSNRFEDDENQIITYNSKVLDFLQYILKAKFRFTGSFGFNRFVDELKSFAATNGIAQELVDDDSHDFSKITRFYFDNKTIVPAGAYHYFIEKTFSNIVNISFSKNDHGQDEFSNKATSKMTNVSKIQLLQNISKKGKKTKVVYDDISSELVINRILFFVEITDLPNYCLVNKKAEEEVKTHIFIRSNFLNNERKQMEEVNQERIQKIEKKRLNFFNEYEIEKPDKNHAVECMKFLKEKDILELKQSFRKFNKQFSEAIAPLCALFGGKSKSKILPDGSKQVSYFETAQKLLNQPNLYKVLMNFELETISADRFTKVEALIEKESSDLEAVKKLSRGIYAVLVWISGVLEFHRVIRPFSLSQYDFEFLSEEEIQFSNELDSLMLFHYKMQRYANNYCGKYKKAAENYAENVY